MQTVELQQVEHNAKIRDKCDYIEPNIKEDCILTLDGVPVGFYMSSIPEKMQQLAIVANAELRSDRVPKATMTRLKPLGYNEMGKAINDRTMQQFSTILGAIPPKALMRRTYRNMSSVHSVPSAQTFIKAMVKLAREGEKLMQEILPDVYARQKELLQSVHPDWRFTDLFTSSISNFNISTPYHRDTANIKETCNIIITKRHNAKGGCLNVPDYGATFEQCDGSILVYPAWMSVHGVTPIIKTHEDGYRNTLIFYALSSFVDK